MAEAWNGTGLVLVPGFCLKRLGGGYLQIDERMKYGSDYISY